MARCSDSLVELAVELVRTGNFDAGRLGTGRPAGYKNPVMPWIVGVGEAMPRILDRLWIALATATDRELTRMIEYLKEENRILRDKLPKRVAVTSRLGMTHLIIDHDSKYVAGFDAVLEADGVEVKRVGPRAPNMNAFAERFVQTLRHELLDYFIIMGEKHLTYLLSEFLSHYHGERPHQGIGNVLIERGTDPPATSVSVAFSSTTPARHSPCHAQR